MPEETYLLMNSSGQHQTGFRVIGIAREKLARTRFA